VPRRAVRIFPTLRTLANFLESDTEPLWYDVDVSPLRSPSGTDKREGIPARCSCHLTGFSAPFTTPTPNGGAMARDIRRQALQRLAALATTSATTSFDHPDLDRLCRAAPSRQAPASAANGHNASLSRPDVGRVPMVAKPR
jgi:hypothetical protein